MTDASYKPHFNAVLRMFSLCTDIKMTQNRTPRVRFENLSKSELPRFGQRQVFCYNSFPDTVLQLINYDFKKHPIKTAQNRILNMKKGGI